MVSTGRRTYNLKLLRRRAGAFSRNVRPVVCTPSRDGHRDAIVGRAYRHGRRLKRQVESLIEVVNGGKKKYREFHALVNTPAHPRFLVFL